MAGRSPFLTETRIVHLRSTAVLFLAAVLAIATRAQSSAPTASQTHSSSDAASITLNSDSAAGFLDQYFAQHREEFHVPGAAVAVVKDGEVLAVKGYGYSNLEKKIPVDAEHTVFRLASVSKVFTATAVMQLVEQGKLRLDENVNDHYLKLFQLEENYPRAVTLQALLTHTAGLDDRAIGATTLSAAEQIPLGPYLARRLGPRVTLPGDQYNYSNDGFSLAGYIVEARSGEPFAQYIQEHILAPLDMRNSGFVITPDLGEKLAAGYDLKRGGIVSAPLDYPNIVPAVSMVSTASDMAHFMLAELQLGQYGTQRILSEDSARRMLARQYTNDTRLPGSAFAYWEEFPKGIRALRQDGDWMGAVSTIYLLPAKKAGIFIAGNVGDRQLVNDLLRQFMDRFYPATVGNSAGRAVVASSDPPARFAGSFRLNRYAHTTIEKIGTLLREWEVRPGENGAIVLLNPNVGPGKYVPAGPLLFRREGAEEEIAFRQDAHGQIDRLFVGRYVLEKLPWWETAMVQNALFAFFGCVFGCAVLGGIVAWIRKGRGTSAALNNKDDRAVTRLRHWTAGVAAANLFFLAGMFLAFLNKGDMIYGLQFYVKVLLCIPLVTTAATLVILWYVLAAWRNRTRNAASGNRAGDAASQDRAANTASRDRAGNTASQERAENAAAQERAGNTASLVFYSFVAFTAVCFVPFLAYWNFLGFHY